MSWHIREAVRCIAAGGVIAYPTETVYGLGCDPFDGHAVLRILALKHRGIDQGLILIADSLIKLEPLLLPLSPATRKRVGSSGPVPVSWVLPCLLEIPAWLRGTHDTLAVRVTRHPVAAALCKRWSGPLVSTSANIHGKHPARNPLAVHQSFHGQLDYILHGRTDPLASPSEIRNGLTGDILRVSRGQQGNV
jgi:L-threonylcarbamoyladenylate synthase